ncbi:MAG: TonB-dependent receptor [Cyclobacteriaceae bacterium]|nr:TonB-dependent receptor [Cyclobacteriaceae bacterium]
MLKFSVATVFLLMSLSSIAQHSISGVIRDDKNNRVLSGATVQVEGSNRLYVSDESGRFMIDRLTDGDQVLRIKFLGYADKIEKVHLQGDVALVILLEETSVMTDEVVVLATRANDKTPTTFVNLSKETLQKQNFGQDLPFLLNWTPSLVTTSDAGTGVGYTGVRIRGSDATRINVTINGIPYNDSESLGTFWVDIPDIASSSQSIQVQRGVGTSTNGAGAFGASINVQTNTRHDNPYAELTNSAGSFGTRRHTLSFGSGLLNDHWVLDGRVSKIVSDGFIDRASSDLQSYYFATGFYAGKTMVKAIVFGGKERTYQSWYGVPESRLNNDEEAMYITAMNEGWNEEQTENLLNSNSRTFNPYLYKDEVDDYRQDHYQLHFSQRFSEALTANAALHYTKGRGYYEQYRYADKFLNYGLSPVVIGDSIITRSDIIRRRWLDNDFYGITYSVNYENDKWNVVFGGAWNRYVGDHFGEIIWAQVSTVPIGYQYYFNKGDKKDFNIFLKANVQLANALNAFVDLQYRKIGYTANGIENRQNNLDVDANFDFFNPKTGLTYSLSSRQQLYASYSVANREPVRDDFVDNPGSSPKPETLHNIEAGYRNVSEKFTLNTNFYWMQYKNQLVLTGALNDVGAPLRTNVDQSYRMGIEVDGLVKFTSRLQWSANFTLSQNKIKQFTEVLYDYGVNFDEYIVVENQYTNIDISFSPSIIAGSVFSYTPFKGGEVSLLTKYVGKQFLDNTANDARSIDAYFVNDIRFGYTWRPSFIKEIGLSVLLNNIFNTAYESNGYTYGYLGGGETYRENFYYPQAGRNFMVMLSLKF